MEFEQLRHFLKVAELGNFTKAADEIGLSQPALSRSIARLEEELGQPMFERQTRRVVLTDAGKLLLPRAQQILSLVTDVKAEIGDDGETGLVRLAAIPTVAPYFLPHFLRHVGEEFPHASVVVQEDTTDHLLKKVSDGVIDIAILARPVAAKYLKIEDLFEEELLLLMSATHALCEKKQVRMSDVESLPFVLLNEAHCLTDNVLSFCRQKAFHPVSVELTSQLATVQELVSLNHGISLVPEMARNLDTSPDRVYRSLTGTKPSRRIVMLSNPYRFNSQLITAVKQRLLNYSRKYRQLASRVPS